MERGREGRRGEKKKKREIQYSHFPWLLASSTQARREKTRNFNTRLKFCLLQDLQIINHVINLLN